jgi:hypothetical protein
MIVPPLPADAHRYDVYFTITGGPRFFLRNPNHGIALGADHMVYRADGHDNVAAFAEIAAIHVQTAALGSAHNVIDQCTITFAGGAGLTVSNATSSGLPDAAQTPVYRAFVHDLHAHLATYDKIRFTAGMMPWRYKTLLIALIVAGLFFVATPMMLTAITGDLTGLAVAVGGAFFCWPFFTLMQKNAPRDYAPDQPPEELLS